MAIRVRIMRGGTENPLCARCGTPVRDTEIGMYRDGKFYHANQSSEIPDPDCYYEEFPPFLKSHRIRP